jgi:hypothetical protein
LEPAVRSRAVRFGGALAASAALALTAGASILLVVAATLNDEHPLNGLYALLLVFPLGILPLALLVGLAGGTAVAIRDRARTSA